MEIPPLHPEIAEAPAVEARRAHMPWREVDAAAGNVRIPARERSQIEALATSELEHAAGVGGPHVLLDDTRLRVVSRRIEAAVRVQSHMHRATRRVAEQVGRQALREVGNDAIEAALPAQDAPQVEALLQQVEQAFEPGIAFRGRECLDFRGNAQEESPLLIRWIA